MSGSNVEQIWQNQDKPTSSLVMQWYRICLPMQETRAQSQGREDPLEEGMSTRSRILAWRIPQTEEPGGLQSMGVTKSQTMT